MTRHVADKRTPSDGGRTKAFLDIERKQGAEEAHPSVQALTRRTRGASGSEGLRQFLRIARGRDV
ncbi:MAG: hypothetical protein Q7J57_01305 [Gemmobacter sp.]|nr:hypothetical protein [Gemmobacter sp.]